LAQATLLGLGYLALAWLGHQLSWQPHPFTTLWLPAGFYVACLLLNPTPRWPWLMVGALAGNLAFELLVGKPLWVAGLFGLGNVAQGLLAAYLVRRWVRQCPASDQLRDYGGFIGLAGLTAPLLGATWGSWVVSRLPGGEPFWTAWPIWFSGDLVGVLLVGPLAIYLGQGGWRRMRSWPAARKAEALVLLMVCATLAWAIFGGWGGQLLAHKYLALPLVLYGAFRFGHLGAFASVLAVAAMATIFGDSEEARFLFREAEELASRVATLQIYLAVLAFTGTAVAVILAQRDSAQELLAQREKQHRRHLESTRSVPFAYDFASDRFTYLGPQMEALLGFPLGSWQGMESWASRIHPDDRQRAVAFCRREATQGRDHEFEYRALAADGRLVWILGTVSVVSGPQGPSGLVGFMRDITENKRIQEDLQASEEKHRFLVESVGVVVWRGHPDTLAFTYVSPEAANLLGYPPADWLEQPQFWAEHLHPQDREKCIRHYQEAARRREPHQYEYRMIAADGRAVWVRDIVNFKVDGGRISEVVGVLMDVTPRKEAELALAASQERLETIAENAPAYIVQLDSQGLIEYCNRAVEGKSMEDMLGTPFSSWVPPEYRPLVDQAVEKVFSSGQAQEYTVPGVGFLGGLAHYQVRLSPVMSEQKVPAVIAMVVDISERVAAEEERQALENQLRQAQKMEAIGTLASGIAHDFNNILAAIFGFTELAADAARNGRDNTRDLEQILASAQRAQDLVRQILTISRKVKPQRRPIDLNQEIGRALKVLTNILPKMISIQTSLTPDLRRLNADPGQINQVLMNLATNAAHAMPEGGRLAIATENVEVKDLTCSNCGMNFSGQYARLSVADSGQGIEPQIMGRLFDPFFTTKEVGQGTGLGLAMVGGIVKSHGGHVVCESSLGRGTNFAIFLPVLEVQAPPTGQDPVENADLPGGNETLLLVDDEIALRQMASRVLSEKGYQVLTAASGEEGRDRYRSLQEEIALVILDLGMPGMGGQRCLEEILTINPAAKVIIASGYAANAQVKAALASGGAAYVAKPFRLGEFLATVRGVLDQK
jgi:PAS domain S-box-containing protein